MRILVTGGTGVVGRSTVTALVQRGFVVNLFSRRARRDAEQGPQGVHPFAGNVADEKLRNTFLAAAEKAVSPLTAT